MRDQHPLACRFSDAYLRAATEKQVLTSTAYRQSIVQQGISNTLNATHVSPGPHHDSTVAPLIQQTTLLLNQLFEIVRRALSTSIHQAFIVSFYLCLAIVITTLFLKDTSATQEKEAKQEEAILSADRVSR